MSKIRRYQLADIDKLIALLEEFFNESRDTDYQNSYYGLDFDKEKVYNLLKSNEKNIRFFGNVIEDDDGEIVGGCFATLAQFIFSQEVVADEKILYIKSGYNNVTALLKLLKSYITWANNRGVKRIQIGTSTGYKQDKFGKLLERLGFEQFAVGYMMKGSS